MKVGIVYPYFAHYREGVINELLQSKRHDYYFFSGQKTSLALSSLKLLDMDANPRFFPLKNFWIFKYFLFQFGVIENLRKRNIETVVLLADWKYLSYWFVLLYCKLTRRQCFFWSHGMLNNNTNLNNKIKFFFHKLFDGGVVYSMRAKNIMQEMSFKKPLFVVNNSLNYEHQNDMFLNRDKVIFVSKIKSPYLIFTGRLVPERNLELLFEAMSILRKENTELNLLIIGKGEHEEALKQKTEDLNLNSQIVFYGACYDETIICKYYNNALACVFPGPIGLTIIHSFTYGAPVITNDDIEHQKPEVEALKNGKNGYFFKNKDAVDLAKKIKLLFSQSPEEHSKFKKCARETVQKCYTPKYQKNILNEMIGKSRGD